MSNRIKSITLLVLLLAVHAGMAYAQAAEEDMLTLFTTRQERELIDKNRYRDDAEQQSIAEAEVEQADTVEAVQQQEEVSLDLKLSGVSLNSEGDSVAWINGQAYENGAEMEDGSRLSINAKRPSQVSLKTPDGKWYVLKAGETETFTFLKPKGP